MEETLKRFYEHAKERGSICDSTHTPGEEDSHYYELDATVVEELLKAIESQTEPSFDAKEDHVLKYTPCHHPCINCSRVDCACAGGDGRFKRCSRRCNSYGEVK